MGTGVGRTSYSIMAQGNITQILSSKPEDRRMIFEEAAGITKFKAQKKESLRKLEYTEQNLLRVADLIREVKRQIGSLQRQAGKARRYKQIIAGVAASGYPTWRGINSMFSRRKLRERQDRGRNLRERNRNEFIADVLRCEDEIIQLRERLSDLEHQIAAMQQRGLELKEPRSTAMKSRIHFNEERLRELASQNSKALADITAGRGTAPGGGAGIGIGDGATCTLRDAALRTASASFAIESRMPCGRSKRICVDEQEALRQAQAHAFPGRSSSDPRSQ